MSFADLDILKEDSNITTSNYQHFIQSWSELYRASYNPNFISLDDLKLGINGNTSIGLKENDQAMRPNINPTVYIGIINTKMNYIDFGTPTQKSLDYNNGYLYNKPGINPFLEKQVTVIAPLKEKITTSTVTFKLQPDYILQLMGSPIKNLTADFGTGATYSLITNGINSSTYPNITFSSSGKKTFIFNITYNDNTTEILKATIDVELPATPVEYNKIVSGIYPEAEDFVGTSGITQTIPFKGYNETTAISGKLEYRTYYNTVSNPGFDSSTRTFSIQPKLRKEVLILDGYDPGDTRKIYPQSSGYSPGHSSIFELMQYDPDDNPQTNNNKNLVRELQEKGYDVTLVNFQNGADYIERNAMALVALLQRENAKLVANGSTEQIAIIGPSMGGLVSRYALAYMEKNNLPHNTRLWVSFDSPHLGANIPIAAQETLYFFGYKGQQEKAKTKFDENFRSPAARQMLIEQLDYAHQDPPYTINLLPNGTVPSGQNNNTTFRYQFTNNLNNNGVSGSNGFPQNLRKIAVINGNTLGVKTNSESQLHLELAAFKIIKYGQIFGTPIQTLINVARIEDRFLSVPYNGFQSFYGKTTVLGNFPYIFSSTTVHRSNPNSRGSMDIVPGGMFNTQGIIKDEFDAALNEAIPGRRSIEWRTYVPNHSFIPTVSSLAFKMPNFDWSTSLNRNLICDTNNKEIPFDSYFAPKTNQDHVFVSGEMVDWLMKELDGEPQAPHFPIDATQFTGANIICLNDTSEYSFPDICKLPGNATWSLSNAKAQVISSNGSSITLKGIENGLVTLTASFQNGQSLTKKIWIGLPSISLYQSPDDFTHAWVQSNDPNATLEDQGLIPSQVVWRRTTEPYTRTGFSYLITTTIPEFDVEVTATNACGSISFIDTVFYLPDCKNYLIVKNGDNHYDIINPCISNPTENRNLFGKGESLQTIVVNIYGQEIINTSASSFDLGTQLPGTYYARIIKDGKIVHTQTLLKN